MASERTQSHLQKHDAYIRRQPFSAQPINTLKRPIDAITFDVVDISGIEPREAEGYHWLDSVVSSLSDELVARKMKEYRNSFQTIDDALVDKVIMEAI